MKKLIALVFLSTLLVSGCAADAATQGSRDTSYLEGYKEGYNEGYESGYEKGMAVRYYEEADFHDDFCQELIWFYKENACIVFPGSTECHIFECDLVQEMIDAMEYYEDADYSFFDQRTAKQMGYAPHGCLVFFSEDVEPVDLSIPAK